MIKTAKIISVLKNIFLLFSNNVRIITLLHLVKFEYHKNTNTRMGKHSKSGLDILLRMDEVEKSAKIYVEKKFKRN